MPNWCQNILKLEHAEKGMILRAVNAYNKRNLLSEFYPEPDYRVTKVKSAFPEITRSEYVEPSEAWWHWRVNNWGTKWDVGVRKDEELNVADDSKFVVMEFYSAWAPPIGVMIKMEEFGYKVELYYWESGNMFCGNYSTGKENKYFEYSSIYDVKEKIPTDIINTFDMIKKLESNDIIF